MDMPLWIQKSWHTARSANLHLDQRRYPQAAGVGHCLVQQMHFQPAPEQAALAGPCDAAGSGGAAGAAGCAAAAVTCLSWARLMPHHHLLYLLSAAD